MFYSKHRGCDLSMAKFCLLLMMTVTWQVQLGNGLEVLVTSICIRSQFNPLIDPLGEIVKRGHSVTLLLYGNCDDWVINSLGPSVANNITIHQSSIDFENLSVDPHDEASDAMYEFGERYEKAFPQTYQTTLDFFANTEEKKSFDVILCDGYSLGAMVVAEQKRIPLVVNNVLLPPINDAQFYGYNSWQISTMKDVLQYLFALRAICKPGTDKVMELRTNLVLQGTYLTPYDYHLGFTILNQGGAILPSSLPPSPRYFESGYRLVESRPINDETLEKWIDQSDKPIVFVTMGSLTNIDYDEIKSVIDNSKTYPFRFLFSLNLKKIKHFEEQKEDKHIEPNVYVAGSEIDTVAVIQNKLVQLIASHCDAKVVLDVLASGKISLCRPGFLEQFYVANFVESQNIGVQFHTDLKFENLKNAIANVEKSKTEISAKVNKWKKELHSRGGVKEAVDFIEKVHKDRLIYSEFKQPIWPFSYNKFYTRMPVLVAVIGAILFVSINVILLFVFSSFSKGSTSAKPKTQ